MKIRITALILTVVMMAVLLTGCGCEHEWTDATCLNPKTCNLCQETEGEALGHTWAEVTCAEPKTCTACGETEGEALLHTWVEANYQAPKTCSECGATEGEPLTADFEKYSLQVNKPEFTKKYTYVTTCNKNEKEKTTAKVMVRKYVTADSMTDDENPDYNLPYKEGYEWKFLKFDFIYSDTNAQKYGAVPAFCIENYYNIDTWDRSRVDISGNIRQYAIDNHSENDVVTVKWIYAGFDEWKNRELHMYLDIAFQVPVGYDGVVIGFYDSANEWEDGMYIYDVADENTLFFRLD